VLDRTGALPYLSNTRADKWIDFTAFFLEKSVAPVDHG
jgi:hypothetical protein